VVGCPLAKTSPDLRNVFFFHAALRDSGHAACWRM
jgi:hypothetical protein